MQADTQVVVIGGGVIGAATLFELARRGITGVLVECGRFGRESTGKSAAIVRMHYSNPEVVRMALRSREIFLDFPARVGGAPVYQPAGWLLLLPDADLPRARQTIAMQQAEGVDVSEIAAERVGELLPGARADGIAAAFYEARSGFADPVATTLGYLDAATALGAEAHQGVSATAILRDGDRVAGVSTPHGTITAPAVVLAAGPWSGTVAAACGVSLPLYCTREQEILVSPAPEAVPACPVSSVTDRFYARPGQRRDGTRSPSVLIGRGYPKAYEVVDPHGYDETVHRAFDTELRARVAGRVPRLAAAPGIGGRAGLYTVTPDWHPLLGPVPQAPGLVLATGGSGHCFKLAPAIGEMVASWMAADPVGYADIGSFSVERFSNGRTFSSIYGGNRA